MQYKIWHFNVLVSGKNHILVYVSNLKKVIFVLSEKSKNVLIYRVLLSKIMLSNTLKNGTFCILCKIVLWKYTTFSK